MGFYGGGWVRQMISIQDPLKFILTKIGKGELSASDAQTLVMLLKNILELPKLNKEKACDPNTRILLDVWEEAKGKHLTDDFLSVNKDWLDYIVNFIVTKFDYDNFYRGLVNWFLEELQRRGWQFPSHNRIGSDYWNTIPPQTKVRLVKSIQDNYDLLQERLKTINEKFDDSEESNIHRKSRFEQFQNRILNDLEREVVAWE